MSSFAASSNPSRPSVKAQDFFTRPAAQVAQDLIGVSMTVDGVGGIIVETEAYDREDPASHAFVGQRPRNAAMFGPVGRAYVYRSYGMHWCLNVVCGDQPGAAVLIRALQPLHGLEIMAERRGLADARALCSGPGKLCQALAVTRAHDGLDLGGAPFALGDRAGGVEIVIGPRIGITKGVETPWRFGLAGSRFVSRPFPKS